MNCVGAVFPLYYFRSYQERCSFVVESSFRRIYKKSTSKWQWKWTASKQTGACIGQCKIYRNKNSLNFYELSTFKCKQTTDMCWQRRPPTNAVTWIFRRKTSTKLESPFKFFFYDCCWYRHRWSYFLAKRFKTYGQNAFWPKRIVFGNGK